MLLLKFLFFTLVSITPLLCFSLSNEYVIGSDDFNASTIDPKIKNDFLIYRFDPSRNRKSFTSSSIIEAFKEHGITLKDESKGIIHVKRASSVELQPIVEEIEKYYLSYYPKMNIEDISVNANGFIRDLPKERTLVFKTNAHRYNRSTLQIISETTKQRYFISYEITATIPLFKARHNINRGKILTPIDLIYSDEPFSRLKGVPIDEVYKLKSRLKKRLRKGKILYERDLEKVPFVLKDENVNVRLISGKVHLEFIAKSLQDGYLGEEIYIQKTDGKRLKAKVIDRNRVEIE